MIFSVIASSDLSERGNLGLGLLRRITCNDIANIFFAIVNNISYNKLEVEKIIFKKNKIFFKKRRIF